MRIVQNVICPKASRVKDLLAHTKFSLAKGKHANDKVDSANHSQCKLLINQLNISAPLL